MIDTRCAIAHDWGTDDVVTLWHPATSTWDDILEHGDVAPYGLSPQAANDLARILARTTECYVLTFNDLRAQGYRV